MSIQQQSQNFFKVTMFGLIMRDLGSIFEVLGSILINNIVNQKNNNHKLTHAIFVDHDTLSIEHVVCCSRL
jgi:hypothetical protein